MNGFEVAEDPAPNPANPANFGGPGVSLSAEEARVVEVGVNPLNEAALGADPPRARLGRARICLFESTDSSGL